MQSYDRHPIDIIRALVVNCARGKTSKSDPLGRIKLDIRGAVGHFMTMVGYVSPSPSLLTEKSIDKANND